MRIVWISWKDLSHPQAGGAEVVTGELLKRLAADGHEVTLLTSSFDGAAPEANHDGYHIVRAGNRFTVYFEAWRYYRQHLRKTTDLVIDECNTIPFFAGWYAGTPTIMFFHMLCRQIWFYQLPMPLSLIGYLAEPLYLRLLKHSPVITVSDSTRRDLIRHGIKSERISIIPEAITLPPVRHPTAAGKDPKYPTFLSFGSIRPMKRTLDQIKAFELARDIRTDLKLIVAGDASDVYGQRVLAYIKASRHASAITYAGRPSQAQKLRLMRRAHAILVTSIKEGWGLIVTEAASQGTPAIVYDVDGLRDSVRPGQTGLIAPSNTPEAMSNAMLELLSDPEIYARLQRAGWTWASQLTFNETYRQFKVLMQQALKTAIAPNARYRV